MSDWRKQLKGPSMYIISEEERKLGAEALRGQVCITSSTRISPHHIWLRAAGQIQKMLDLDYFVKQKAVQVCFLIVEQIPVFKYAKPPQFSWKGIPGKL